MKLCDNAFKTPSETSPGLMARLINNNRVAISPESNEVGLPIGIKPGGVVGGGVYCHIWAI